MDVHVAYMQLSRTSYDTLFCITPLSRCALLMHWVISEHLKLSKNDMLETNYGTWNKPPLFHRKSLVFMKSRISCIIYRSQAYVLFDSP